MKITRLHAERVHGYLPIDIDFFEDLTFLTGVNGSGKTSALRLLMALLAPNLEELGAISFSNAAVTIQEANEQFVVSSQKSTDGVSLSVSSLNDVLTISSSDLELYMDVRRREEPRSLVLDKYQQHPVFQRIKSISTPMFLGLDRRFYAPGLFAEDMNEARRREYAARRYWPEEYSARSSSFGALVEVNYLVVNRMQEIRAEQEKLDERLRAQFFSKAFEYKPSDIMGKPTNLPSRTEIERYRKQLIKIERAAEGLKIPIPEIQSALTAFFGRMSSVVESMDKSAQPKRPVRKTSKRSVEKKHDSPVLLDKDYFEWIINKPQADRILEHLTMLDAYIENRNAVRDPINRFLNLVNNFLLQTRKALAVTGTGQLMVSVLGDVASRPISALSSGERQLLVMLAHLSLNSDLAGSGVFIVDEPELSLHIDWQEKFVDAVREANPKVQLILATHSPAIILDRVESCRDLGVSTNA